MILPACLHYDKHYDKHSTVSSLVFSHPEGSIAGDVLRICTCILPSAPADSIPIYRNGLGCWHIGLFNRLAVLH